MVEPDETINSDFSTSAAEQPAGFLSPHTAKR